MTVPKGDIMPKISKIRGVTWEWSDDAPDEAKAQPGIGVIAQEVERVFPELVSTDENGIKRVYYAGLIGPLIEAVKELDARVRTLEAELAIIKRERL
jgi:hypothetical protein